MGDQNLSKDERQKKGNMVVNFTNVFKEMKKQTWNISES